VEPMSGRDPWQAAARIGGSLAGPGFHGLTRAAMADTVAGLRKAAARAPELVAGVTGLGCPTSVDLIIDRAGIVAANTATCERLFARAATLDPTLDLDELTPPATVLGAVLSLLARRILGQFDPFGEVPRLLLVAPNIAGTERDLNANPADFRLWVCLHEQTHRAQFGAAPWLPDHLIGLVASLLAAEAKAETSKEGLPARVRRLRDARRGDPASTKTSIGLLAAVSDPATAATLGAVTAVMSLLEGYADVMMDAVGPTVIPTVATIRAGFDERRARGGLVSLLGKLIGFDAKLAQYAEGAAFCRTVLDAAGLAVLNRAFERADNLPTLEELRDPPRWLSRIAPPAPEPAGDPGG